MTIPSPIRVSSAVLLWMVQALVTAFTWTQVFLSRLAVASCSDTSCDYPLFSGAMQASDIGAIVLLVGSAAGIVALRKSPQYVTWPPTIGIIAVVILMCTTYTVGRGALDLPLFGNRPA
ncbi:hypothetical protein ACF044_15850 [Microbacterium sp. NPDC016588]